MDLIWKTALIYVMTLFIMKFMGKREIGQLSLFDFIVLLLIADLLVIAVEKEDQFFYFLIPVFVLVVIQKLLAFLVLKIKKTRELIDGTENIIVYEGKLVINEMKKQFYNVDDLLTQLRLKNVPSLKDVKYLFLETNGEISVFLKNEKELKIPGASVMSKTSNVIGANSNSYLLNDSKTDLSLFPLITSGKINQKFLDLLGIKEEWIIKETARQNQKIEDIYYACLDKDNLFIIETMEFQEKNKKNKRK